MIILCEECGKKYRVDPSKVGESGLKFKCKACNHIITVSKPETKVPAPESFIVPEQEVVTEKTETPPSEPEEKPEKRASLSTDVIAAGKKAGLGLRSKMMLLFFVLPIVIVVAAGILYLQQMSSLSKLLTEQSAESVREMAEELVKEKARSASKQVNLYLSTHPEFKKEDFSYEMNFRLLAVQKVGITGYTCLYSIPDEQGVSSLWVHPNAKLIGVDLPKTMQKALGKEYHKWWKVYKGAYNGQESMGYYTWQDADGTIREKFMVCTPVEGTPYVVAATTNYDEFTRPIEVMKTRAQKLIGYAKYIILAIIIGTIVSIGLIVTIYGNMLVNKIKSLTDLAQRISIGDLEAEAGIKSKDEIGDLYDAIVRMQESIRLSMERLRRRRK
ncbi:MAG: HAMP domain-containing protein [Desulfobacteraceae bacterium]|nr:MAG: HAMP domain-containing protein [Desulfobacteraceae bacterium]